MKKIFDVFTLVKNKQSNNKNIRESLEAALKSGRIGNRWGTMEFKS